MRVFVFTGTIAEMREAMGSHKDWQRPLLENLSRARHAHVPARRDGLAEEAEAAHDWMSRGQGFEMTTDRLATLLSHAPRWNAGARRM